MGKNQSKHIIEELLDLAGVKINGPRPYDIQVHNDHFYERVFNGGYLSLGESFMDGWWDCQSLDQFIDRVMRANIENAVKKNGKLSWHILKSRLFNLQNNRRANQVAESHYDIGNEFYRAMLDRRMVYTCAYWNNAADLDAAQEAKLDLVCRKINLEPGMTVLELGCGFGSFARYAAEKYGATVTGLNISREQVNLGREICKGLPVELKLADYRNAEGMYDRVVSIGIMEHVGYKNYRMYMETVNRTLKDDGIAFFHTVGGNVSKSACNEWTSKYIFPNGVLPSISQLGRAMEGLFVMEDWHNFGPDYDRTLMAWHDRFARAWPDFKNKYSDRFRRMWRFYLLCSAGAFRSRTIQLWQVVMTKPGRAQPDCRLN
jgi:cyclopropane-fatty-acyl-phospholipid synthase